MPFTKINSKWIRELNVKCRTMNSWKATREETCMTMTMVTTFQNRPKGTTMEEAAEKLNFMRIQDVCCAEDPSEGKASHRLRENICARHV